MTKDERVPGPSSENHMPKANNSIYSFLLNSGLRPLRTSGKRNNSMIAFLAFLARKLRTANEGECIVIVIDLTENGTVVN